MSSHEYLLPDRTWDRPEGQRPWWSGQSCASCVDLYLRFRPEKCPGAVPQGHSASLSLPVWKRDGRVWPAIRAVFASRRARQSIALEILAGAGGLLLT
jgi:hypothetical protein